MRGATCRTGIPEVGASPWAKVARCCRQNGAGDGAAVGESNRPNCYETNRPMNVVDRETTVAATSHSTIEKVV